MDKNKCHYTESKKKLAELKKYTSELVTVKKLRNDNENGIES